MHCAENAMTVVGVPHIANEGVTTLKVRASHYAQAVQALLEELAFDLAPDLEPDEVEDPQAQADADREGWDLACDHFKTVRVYRGHPPEGSDAVTALELIHEE